MLKLVLNKDRFIDNKSTIPAGCVVYLLPRYDLVPVIITSTKYIKFTCCHSFCNVLNCMNTHPRFNTKLHQHI